MVSRRKFFYIFIMMAVLLFMFQFSQVIKESGNNYDVNEFVTEQPLSGAGQWESSQNTSVSESEAKVGSVLFLGDNDSELKNMITQWCTYTKRQLVVEENSTVYDANTQVLPEVFLIDSEGIDFDKETDNIIEMTKAGVPIIFCNLPDVEVIQQYDELAKLLGIAQIKQNDVTLEGVHLFSGFILGGEAVYKVQNESEEEMQDLELDIPWYITGKGTKTYMVGMLNESDVTYDDFPRLIWRNYYNGTMIFAVNGDYMSGLAGLGILEAMVYEANAFTLYPVINAQNTILADLPRLAPENAEKMEEIYSREPSAVVRDVMWPGIVSMVMNDKLKLTCCFSTKYNYTDLAQLSDEEIPFYLQQMKEIGAEAGRSLNFGEGITLEEKLQIDEAFYDSLENQYEFSAVYIKEITDNMPELIAKGDVLKEVRTIASAYNQEIPLVSYYQDNITLQGITGNAMEYSYAKDLQMRGIASALGYSNMLIDMNSIIWPETTDDQWENYFDEVYSNVSTYWTGYDAFARTTLSESDARIRTFLNLDYAFERANNVIMLKGTDEIKDAWFILRLHGEEIEKLENAEYQKLEEGAYLIHTLSDEVKIYLQKSAAVLEYRGAFEK